MLTIDKIKDPQQLYDLHEIAYNTDTTDSSVFNDLSLPLTHEDHIGWMEMLRNYEKKHNISLSSVSADVIKDATMKNKMIYTHKQEKPQNTLNISSAELRSNGKSVKADGTSKDNSSNKRSNKNHAKEAEVDKEQLRKKISTVNVKKRRTLRDEVDDELTFYHDSESSDQDHTNYAHRDTLLEFAFFYHKML